MNGQQLIGEQTMCGVIVSTGAGLVCVKKFEIWSDAEEYIRSNNLNAFVELLTK